MTTVLDDIAPVALDDPMPADRPLNAPDRRVIGLAVRCWLAAHWHVLALLGLTALGAWMRFFHIGHPALWGDEGMVFGRAAAGYQDLLDRLQLDGFAPLHYSLYWWIGQGMPVCPDFVFLGIHFHAFSLHHGPLLMTPLVMRFVPAISGTLMIPAVYFLARQMFRPSVALLSAALACCSAYMMVYSRDAKMYMDLWLMVTLHIACFLWWLNTGRRMAWLAWIACGLAATGIHISAATILLIEPVILLTAKQHHWRKFLLTIFGLAVIGAGPLGYYSGFNHFLDRTDEDTGNWDAQSGLNWIADWQGDRDGPALVLHTATSFLYSWEWPKNAFQFEAKGNGTPVIPPVVMTAGTLAFSVLTALLFVGALPWPGRSRDCAAVEGPDPAGAWWRPLLWLSVWIVIPVYAFFYCRSVPDFSAPEDFVLPIFALGQGQWGWTIARMLAIAFLAVLLRPRPVVMAGFAVFAGGALFSLYYLSETPIGASSGAWKFIHNYRLEAARWIMSAALTVLAPLGWYYSGPTVWHRTRKLLQLTAVAAGVLALCYVAWRFWDLKRTDDMKKLGGAWQSDWRRRMIWMPRYMGTVWPAVCVGVAALMMRIPTRALRASAIAVLLSANLVNAGARVLGDSEPPIDRVAADIWDGQVSYEITSPDGPATKKPTKSPPPARHTRTFTEMLGGGGHPGYGSLLDAQGRYYLAVLAEQRPRWWEFRPQPSFRVGEDFMGQFRFLPADPGAIQQEVVSVENTPGRVDRVIVWYRWGFSDPPPLKGPWLDPVLGALGPGWKRANVEDFYIRQHWSWREVGSCRRIEYLRAPLRLPQR